MIKLASVNDKQLCLACCCNHSNRYIVLDSNGKNGSAFNCFTSFYNVTLVDNTANYGTYVCIHCKKAIEQALRLEEKLSALKTRLSSKINYTTSDENVAHANGTTETIDLQQQVYNMTREISKHPVTSKATVSQQQSLRQRNKTCHTALKNGSIRKVLLLLHRNKSSTFVKVLQYIIGKEVSKLSQQTVFRRNEFSELLRVQFKDIIGVCKNLAPTLWSTLAAAAATANYDTSIKPVDNRILQAVAVLLYTRNRRLNVLQYALSMFLYQNKVQKEGLIVLNKLGITVSYDAMQRKLNEAAQQSASIIYTWKREVELNQASFFATRDCLQYNE
jgi:hypothetical protein